MKVKQNAVSEPCFIIAKYMIKAKVLLLWLTTKLVVIMSGTNIHSDLALNLELSYLV